MIKYNVPSPIIDLREKKSLDKVTRDYEKMLEPGPVQKAGDVIAREPFLDRLKRLPETWELLFPKPKCTSRLWTM